MNENQIEQQLVRLLQYGNQLKQTVRTGWLQRGVPQAESVAAHSYGVVFTALLLAPFIPVSLDLGRVLAMAALHDLPEALTTDIPTPAWRHLPQGSKLEVERAMMAHMAAQSHSDWLAIWEDLQAAESAEARLVHDADKIDLYLQALIYEEQSGNLRLAEFWENVPTFHYPTALHLYERLRERRASLRSP